MLSTAAPIVLITAVMQPLNAYTFVGDGVLQGSQDFVYEVSYLGCHTEAGLMVRQVFGAGFKVSGMVRCFSNLEVVSSSARAQGPPGKDGKRFHPGS